MWSHYSGAISQMKPFIPVSLGVMMVLLSGCSYREQQQAESSIRRGAQTTVSTVKQGGKIAVKTLDRTVDLSEDAALTGSVKTRLLADKWIGATGIDVTTKDNIVTLTGKVAGQKQKARATKIARETAGVRSVVNKLAIGK
jgi:osmotically-inducible protein OsmY